MRALVTGAASGIGRATCLRLARDGRDKGTAAKIAAVDLAPSPGLDEMVREARAAGAEVVALHGDMGTADERGFFYFQGRGDDVIKTSGYRVGPAEIEAKIMEVAGVASCAVIGVSDPQRGQAIKAFVKVLPGTDCSDELIKRIQEHVKKKLAAHEYPREIAFVEELPMTTTGKIIRRELRARAAVEARRT